MTIPVSTAPQVKAYLVTLFKAAVDTDSAASDPNVLVSYNEPGNYEPDNLVIVGKAARRFAPTRMIGSGAANWGMETVSIDVEVSVRHSSLDPQPCEERVWHLIGLLDQALRTDPGFGGLVIQGNSTTAEVEAFWNEAEGADGWVATGTFSIGYTANL